MKSRKKLIYLILSIVLLALGIASAGIAVQRYLQEKNAGRQYEKLAEEVTASETASPEPEDSSSAGETTAENPQEETPAVQIPIDFAALQERNPDAYAWITIPDTAVNYPVLQRTGDNGYYLTHDLDGKESLEGAIYTEDYNTKTFEDPNTVLYGHNMKNGSMFRGLHDYADREFFDSHREILIYLPDSILHYQVFAAYEYDDRHLMQSFDFSNPDVMESYLSSILSTKSMDANIDREAAVGRDNKIITLSTCKGSPGTERRYLVQAVLVSIEK